jgi:hypothetical protein
LYLANIRIYKKIDGRIVIYGESNGGKIIFDDIDIVVSISMNSYNPLEKELVKKCLYMLLAMQRKAINDGAETAKEI